MAKERRERAPYVVYTVPPSVDAKTCADIQSKWVEVRLKEIEAGREKAKAFVELAREGMSSL